MSLSNESLNFKDLNKLLNPFGISLNFPLVRLIFVVHITASNLFDHKIPRLINKSYHHMICQI